MRYVPVRTLADLEALERSTESRSLDFKEKVDPDAWWELAKDIAAFANHVGGTILVGASEKPDNTATFFGVSPAKTRAVQLAYENAAKDKCRPRPIIIPEPLPLPNGRTVLAVNVEPFPLGLVGAMFYALDVNGKPQACDAWRFPMRVGKHNVPLQPDQIAMFIEPRIRRIVTLLEGIPEAAHEQLHLYYVPSEGGPLAALGVGLMAVEVMQNVVIFTSRRDGKTRGFKVPLDDVESVWEGKGGEWQVRVSGYLVPDEEGHWYVSGPSRARPLVTRFVNID